MKKWLTVLVILFLLWLLWKKSAFAVSTGFGEPGGTIQTLPGGTGPVGGSYTDPWFYAGL
jgi:hypothetical protein